MQSVDEIVQASLEVKKSLFISYLVPLHDFESLHSRLKLEHPKAAHIVWAKRSLNEYAQIVENNSDDGEPKGTSGPPVLNVMRGYELINVGILIVRYFGGIKLGTGGLVRAYGSSAKEVIACASLKAYVTKEAVVFTCEYPLIPRFEHYCASHGLLFERKFEVHYAHWTIQMSQEEKEAFLLFAHPFSREGFNLL
ncbi:MAG: YigZ family protein [Sulfurospirillaceae bacterium]|nr:YigZ family protein [Sulfurospirillaceae bacterium]